MTIPNTAIATVPTNQPIGVAIETGWPIAIATAQGPIDGGRRSAIAGRNGPIRPGAIATPTAIPATGGWLGRTVASASVSAKKNAGVAASRTVATATVPR